MARDTRSSWRHRWRRWWLRELQLFGEAQAEALGGSVRAPAPDPQTPESHSPHHPSNWSHPHESHQEFAQGWRSTGFEFELVGQTLLGRGDENQAHFGIFPGPEVALVAAADAPDWRVPATLLDAVTPAWREVRGLRLPCYCGHPGPCIGERAWESWWRKGAQALRALSREHTRSQALSRPVPRFVDLAGLHFCCGRAWCALQGGARIYLWRQGTLFQLFTIPELAWSSSSIYPLKLASFALRDGDLLGCYNASLAQLLPEHAIRQILSQQTPLEDAIRQIVDIAWNAHCTQGDIALLLCQIRQPQICESQNRLRHLKERWEDAVFDG